MTKIYCADIGCRFCREDGTCMAKTVSLSWSSVMTVNDGRQEYHRCKTRKPNELEIEIKKKLIELEIQDKFKGRKTNG